MRKSWPYHLRIISSRPAFFSFLAPLRLLKNPLEYFVCLAGFSQNRVCLLTLKNGQKYFLRPGTKDYSILIENIYQQTYFLKDMGGIERGNTVIDLGAHTGTFTVPAALAAGNGTVYAIEPEFSNYKLLLKNIRANNCNNVTVINAAISSEEGEVSLFIDRHNTGMHSTSIENKSSRVVKVPTITLGRIMTLHNIREVSFLKIDTEGSEYDALYSLDKESLAKVDRIALEYHQIDSKAKNEKALIKFLEDNGFTVRKQSFPGSVIGLLYAWKG